MIEYYSDSGDCVVSLIRLVINETWIFAGVANVKCHEKFKKCIKRVQKSGKAGFSWECPYAIAVPTMVQGMDLAILMSQFATGKVEL